MHSKNYASRKAIITNNLEKKGVLDKSWLMNHESKFM